MITSNDLEARLRAELRAEAGRVLPAQVRPLTEPTGSLAAGRGRPAGGPRRRVLAPLAAAVAVLAVVAGVSLAGLGGRPRPGPSGTRTAGGFPLYYVTLDVRAYPSRLTVAVHDSASGRVLSAKRLPLGFGFGPVIATADDRQFILAVPQPRSNDTRLLRLQVGPGGRSLRVSALALPPFPYGQVVSGLAVSPDRRQLAVLTFQYNFARNNTGSAELEVASLTSLRRARVRFTTPFVGAGLQPAWVGRTRLAFTWQAAVATKSAEDRSGVRLLDLSAHGSDLLSARLVLPAVLTRSGLTVESALMSADGRAILASVTSGVTRAHGGTITGLIALIRPGARPEFTVLRLTRSHYRDPQQYKQLAAACDVVSATPFLQHALTTCWQFSRLDGRTFTALPGATIGSESAW